MAPLLVKNRWQVRSALAANWPVLGHICFDSGFIFGGSQGLGSRIGQQKQYNVSRGLNTNSIPPEASGGHPVSNGNTQSSSFNFNLLRLVWLPCSPQILPQTSRECPLYLLGMCTLWELRVGIANGPYVDLHKFNRWPVPRRTYLLTSLSNLRRLPEFFGMLTGLPSLKLTAHTLKWMVGKQTVAFWDGYLPGRCDCC